MPHYLVERTFHSEAGLSLPGPHDSLRISLGFTENDDLAGVSRIHFLETPNRNKSFCLCEGPNPEAVHRTTGLYGLPIDRISEVHFQTPYEITWWAGHTAFRGAGRAADGGDDSGGRP